MIKTYTPGPWEADDIFVGAVASDGYHVICRGEDAYANARVIAAIPELLAALEEVDSYLHALLAIQHDDVSDTVRKTVVAAINKATGA